MKQYYSTEFPFSQLSLYTMLPGLRNLKYSYRYTIKMGMLLILSFSIVTLFFSSCRNNPVDSSGFLTKAGPILFISDKNGTSQLYSMNEDGSNARQLTNDPNFPILDARWSPDGNKIAVESPQGGIPLYGNTLYIMNADGTDRQLLTKPEVTIYDSTWGTLYYAGAMHPVWSPDSKQIAYSRLMVPEVLGNIDVFIINADGTGERRITKTINSSENVTDWGGKRETLLAWVMVGSSPFTKVIVFDTTGTEIKSWNDNEFGYLDAVYSTSGDMIALVKCSNPASMPRDSIYVLGLIDDSFVNITKGDYKFYSMISWSPGDSRILVSASNGDVDKLGRSLNRILILSLNGAMDQDVTPFSNVYVLPTSWRRR